MTGIGDDSNESWNWSKCLEDSLGKKGQVRLSWDTFDCSSDNVIRSFWVIKYEKNQMFEMMNKSCVR